MSARASTFWRRMPKWAPPEPVQTPSDLAREFDRIEQELEDHERAVMASPSFSLARRRVAAARVAEMEGRRNG